MKVIVGFILGSSISVVGINANAFHIGIQKEAKPAFMWVPDARTASAVGRAILAGQYGDIYVENFKRMVVRKKNGFWFIRPQETVTEGLFAQEFEVVIDPVTGRVVDMHSYIPSLDKD